MENKVEIFVKPKAKNTNESPLRFRGLFTVECFDAKGNLKWKDIAKNAATDEGLNHILDVQFHGETPVSPWYIGLIKGTGTLAAEDTLASHAGWTECVLTTDYTGNRKEWTEGASSGKSMTNAVTVDFAMLTSITVKGAFLCGAATLTAAKLFCTALFTGGDQAVDSGDTLKVTYSVSAAAA